ncbi:MAG: substrate-binding domain-containing protein, partial [Gemmatimonadales bacterium]
MKHGMFPGTTRALAGLWAAGFLLGFAAPAAGQSKDVVFATTTSVQDTGLLDSLVPRFERLTGYRVKPIAVGTGQALALAGRGEADVVLAHAPDLEARYVKDGVLIDRRLVMVNDFVLLGPPSDPAGVAGMTDPAEAMRTIAQSGAVFVSRGDSSGTNLRERSLWEHAVDRPAPESYIEVGQGMAATLRVASEKGGYTLSDRGTYLALRTSLALRIVSQGAPELKNFYSVSRVNPAFFPNVNAAGALAFAAYLLDPATQAIIGAFGVERFGQPLFTPAAGDA